MAPVKPKGNSTTLAEAFGPVRCFLSCTGQLPFSVRKRKADGTHEFHFSCSSCNTCTFGLVCILNVCIFITVTVGFVSILLNLGVDDKSYKIVRATPPFFMSKRPWEEIILLNHLALVIVIYTFLTLTFFSSTYLLFNGVRCYLQLQVASFFLMILGEGALFWKLPGIRATAGLFVTMMLRFVVPGLPGEWYFPFAEIGGFIVIVYAHVASRAIMIQFVFFTKLLKNLAEDFNSRLRNATKQYLTREPAIAREERESFQILLKDHLIIVQLFEMTSSVFGLILKVYFASEFVAILFALFYLWELVGPDRMKITATPNNSLVVFPKVSNYVPGTLTKQDQFTSELHISETCVTVFLLLQRLVSCLMTTSSANASHIELGAGYKIVRNRGLIMSRTKTERNFVYSMMVSYGRIQPITADGYFNVTKVLFSGLVLCVCSTFVIMIQFDFPRYVVSSKAYLQQWDKLETFSVDILSILTSQLG